MSDAIHDVRPEQYASTIREMLRHENDLTNHRIMWLLVGQGFIANAFLSAGKERPSTSFLFTVLGIVLSISAFAMLYRSYQARAYLRFLGQRAKQGTLQEGQLPILGWPPQRIKGWSKEVWAHSWIARAGDLVEPWFFLPYIFVFVWVVASLRSWTALDSGAILMLAFLVATVVFTALCTAEVRSRSKGEV